MNATVDTLLAKLDTYPGSLVFARLADMYLRVDKIPEAIAICEQGLARYPGYASGHMVMAKCYARVGLRDQAVAELERTLELDGTHPAGLLTLGDLYAEGKQIHLSLQTYQRLLATDPINLEARKRMASLAGKSRRKHLSDESPAATIDPDREEDNTISTATLAEIYASQGLTEKAIEIFQRVLSASPQRDDILRRIQTLEKRLKEEEEGGTNGIDG